MATETTIFHNSNGLDFNILLTLEFNTKDREYYKGCIQKHKVMLLERNQEYIVATYVGDSSWGSGYYADGIKDAYRKFNSIVTDYLMK